MILVPARANDGTRVTSGAMVFGSDTGEITMSGQSGFTESARVSVSGGVYDPWNQCSVPECPPGTQVSLHAFWTGLDLVGTASLRGRDYALGDEGPDGAS